MKIDDPGPGYVRVKVSHCGICHSDLTVTHSGMATPIVLGHEAAGVVDAVGEGVTILAPGDSVVLTPIAPCGRCYFCVRGEAGLCVNNRDVLTNTFADGTTGLSRNGDKVYRGLGVGGFAEYVLTTETGAIRVPDDTPLDVVCVIGCAVQTGVGAVLNTAQVEPGATVLVLGLGGIGQSVVQGARVAGASRIIASDPIAARREAALRLGATDVIDPGADDVAAVARSITDVGPDYAFECAGMTALAHVGIAATRPGGMTVLVGAPSRRPGDHDRPRGAVRHRGEAAQRLLPRQLQLAPRRPPDGRPVAGGPARPRGAHHPPAAARRDQRGLRRRGSRPRHPHRPRDVASEAGLDQPDRGRLLGSERSHLRELALTTSDALGVG